VLEKRWFRAAVVFMATAVLLLLQDALRGGKPAGNHHAQSKEEHSLDAGTYFLEGEVVEVIDGDTLRLRSEPSGILVVRLASIDAPEKTSGVERPGQPMADESRDFLASRVLGAQLQLLCYEQDRYERHVCDVPDPKSDPVQTVNRTMVQAGMAWANTEGGGKFMRDDELPGLQDQAREQGKGLWRQSGPVAPWQWRYQCWRNGQCG